MTPRPVRLGIVGLGAVAQAVHLPLLARLPDRFAISAICDLSRSLVDSLGARYGVPASARTTDPTDLLARDDLDGFLVLTSGSHAPLAAAALETGRPVFVEKPLAYTVAEADRLAEIARASGGRLQLGYMKLYDPAVVAARRILRP
ncbi:MAG TPA: Gfo/Idh/MocA family oxidoreductase, partial [Candidatus Limnocylindrales bacterium]|nr:Gfo/Idh/MocA family oxidoreductase [Candidatus Limnocylindrales bacterium]